MRLHLLISEMGMIITSHLWFIPSEIITAPSIINALVLYAIKNFICCQINCQVIIVRSILVSGMLKFKEKKL